MTPPSRRAPRANGALALALALAPLVLPAPILAQVTPADSARAAAPAGPPGTDVWIATLSVRGAAVRVGAPLNATRRPGYDNQPAFSRDGRFVLYTSIRDGQADIWRYDRRAGTSERLTRTPESEYSPTPLPAGRGFSVIRVERDSTQRLWRFADDGTAPALVLERVKPVGYHAWADAHTLLLFVLGEPATLQRADTRTGDARVVTDSIGRSLHRIPGQHAMSFIRKPAGDRWWIERYDLRDGRVSHLVETLPGSEDYAWTPGGVALMARDTVVYAWDPKRDRTWREVARFSAVGLGRITRIAVSPGGDRIAFVAEEPAAPAPAR